MTAYTTRYFLAAICAFFVSTTLYASEGGTLIVTISEVPRAGSICYGVAPHNQTNYAAVTVSGLQAGDSVVVDVINQSAANGKALIGSGGTITSNTGWFPAPVGVQGDDEQTDDNVGQQLRIRARKNGTGGDLAQSPPFAVCAHPTNFRQWGAPTEPEDGVLQFKYLWDSDCGHNPHLNLCGMDERIVYPGSDPYEPPDVFFWIHTPNPFYFPPQLIGGESGTTADPFVDAHGHGYVDEDGPAGSYTGQQRYRFRCVRCDCHTTTDRQSHAFGDWLTGQISIEREVPAFEVHGKWVYFIYKSGYSAQMDLADQ